MDGTGDDYIFQSKGSGMAQSAVYYGLAQAHLLTEHLSRKQLPGLTSQEQMYLLALSDTVASTNFEFEGDSVKHSAKHNTGLLI